MATWREKGYVPDSEDEEEDDLDRDNLTAAALPDLNNNQSPESVQDRATDSPLSELTPSPPPSPPSKLDRDGGGEIEPKNEVGYDGNTAIKDPHASQAIVDKLKSPDAQDHQLVQAQGSSSVGDNKEGGLAPGQSGREAGEKGPAHIANDPDKHIDGHDPAYEVHEETGYSRTLRRRKPIQLNPYLIEQEKYKQTLRARGIKPLRIEEAAPEDDSQDHQGQSQDEFTESIENEGAATGGRQGSAVEDIEPAQSDEQMRELEEPVRRKAKLTRRPSAEPDVFFSTMGRNGAGIRDMGFKRRKLREIDQNLGEQTKMDYAYSLPSSGSVTPRKTPQSQSRRGSEERAASMTPVVRKRNPIIDLLSSSSEESSDSESEPDDLVHFRRKTAGVLPASWWKLDLKKQNEQQMSRKAKANTALDQSSSGSGIARAKLGRKGSRANNSFIADDESSSGSEEESPRIQSKAAMIQTTLSKDKHVSMRQENTNRGQRTHMRNDSEIDRMLQRGPSNLPKSWQKQRRHNVLFADKRSLKSKSVAEHLPDIIDDSSNSSRGSPSAPNYLKLAKRSARKVFIGKKKQPHITSFMGNARKDRGSGQQSNTRQLKRVSRPVNSKSRKQQSLRTGAEKGNPAQLLKASAHNETDATTDYRDAISWTERVRHIGVHQNSKKLSVGKRKTIRMPTSRITPQTLARYVANPSSTSTSRQPTHRVRSETPAVAIDPPIVVPSIFLPRVKQTRKDNQPSRLLNEDAVRFRELDHIGSNTLKLDYNYVPLDARSVFNENSLLNSGGVERLFKVGLPRICPSEIYVEVSFRGRIFEWGPFNESCAAEFEWALEEIGGLFDINELELSSSAVSESESFFRHCVNYISDTVTFSDAVDVDSFVDRWSRSLFSLQEQEEITNDNSMLSGNTGNLLRISVHYYTFLLAYQLYKISRSNDRTEITSQLEDFLSSSARKLLVKCKNDKRDLVDLYKKNQAGEMHKVDYSTRLLAESVVVVATYFEREGRTQSQFWESYHTHGGRSIVEPGADYGFSKLEECWDDIFALLPILGLRPGGLVASQTIPSDWKTISTLSKQAVAFYKAGTLTFANEYLRTTLRRIFSLIWTWKWPQPFGIILEYYQFFVQMGLGNLAKELDRGSLPLLQDLGSRNSPELTPRMSDTCFHCFLKVLAAGLLSSRDTISERELRDFVHRLIPNHGRLYLKSEPLQVEHLIALRNHHDLLSVLYWAVPPKSRPPIEAIKDLVDAKIAHREACDVSITAWSNLLAFQLKDNCGQSFIEPLMNWFDAIIEVTLFEHLSVRASATAEVQDQGVEISPRELDLHIRRNQRHLEAILIKGLTLLGRSMDQIPGNHSGLRLIFSEKATISFFEASNRLNAKLLRKPIELLSKYMTLRQTHISPSPAVEDSQDYGDWSGLDDYVMEDDGHMSRVEDFPSHLFDAYFRMLSNLFGADQRPEDSLLQCLIDAWCQLISYRVKHSDESWEAFVTEYGRFSWSSLRNTIHKRQYSAYLMAKLIHVMPEAYEANKIHFLRNWALSVVERESLLKFEHKYTQKLAHVDRDNPLLLNLMVSSRNEQPLEISMQEFKRRRLDVISTTLLNIHGVLSRGGTGSTVDAVSLRDDCQAVLGAFMGSMKQSHQEVTSVESASQKNSHTVFIQQVVGLFKQYLTGLYTVDRFFTDPLKFPLPEHDPLYIISQLRSYGMQTSFTMGGFISYFNTLVERAISENRLQALSDKVTKAILDDCEARRFRLRTVLFSTLLPSYVEFSKRTAVGEYFSIPVLRSSSQILAEAVRNFDNTTEWKAVVEASALVLSRWNVSNQKFISSGETPYLARIAASLSRLESEGELCNDSRIRLREFVHRYCNEGRAHEDVGPRIQIELEEGQSYCLSDLKQRGQSWRVEDGGKLVHQSVSNIHSIPTLELPKAPRAILREAVSHGRPKRKTFCF